MSEFHPVVSTWFEERFGEPSPAQRLGWPVIADAQEPPGHDVLLCAPTGSGKTLAAFLWAINRLVIEAERGDLREEVSVLYVSPLKALANDIRINLEEPLAGVRAVAASRGLDLSVIRAGLRTGDTSAGERTAMLRRPPQILVTTPESLFILLTSPRFREKLRAVRYVVVDELHAIADNKRGAHLMLTLERLERMVRTGQRPRPTRIGLSATLNPIETLAKFLAGGELDAQNMRHPRPVRIVRADGAMRGTDTGGPVPQAEAGPPREIDLRVIAPGPETGSLATHQHWEAMYDALASLIGEHRTTLVFTLSRRWAERIALALQKRVGADAVMAHHSSLARAERISAEQRLKRGELKAIVATASLELGIDVGAVDLVCQVDSPKSISAVIQRVGRSGHTLGGKPKGRFFALTIDDLLECAAAVYAIRQGHQDKVEIPSGCADVAAQQIVAIAAEEDELSETELLGILRGGYNFADFDLAGLRRLLVQMAAQLPDRIQGANPKIFYDQLGGRVRARRGARLAAITSGGTIPESGNLDVVIASEGRKIGDVEEDFAQESSRGDIFSLGSMPWRVLGISKNRFLVEPAPGMAPSLPFWQTEAAGRSPGLCAEVCEIRRRIGALLFNNANAAVRWLMTECALEETAAQQAVDHVRRGLAALGAVPDERTLVVERFFDGLGGTQVVIHAPLGIRLNRGLGLALRKRLCQSFDFEIQASAIDDAVLLALNSRHSFPLEHILTMLTSRSVRATLAQALLDAPMFEVRFRHVATRALTIMRSMRGRKVAAWIQRLRTQELITALFPQRNACFDNRPVTIDVPEHFIVDETLRECLEETADIQGLERLLRGIEDGSIRTVLVDSVAPSVFAHKILLAWDYSFLDDGERANRRSRTVTMNRAMAEEVFRTEDLAEVLSAEAIEAVVAEASGLTPGRRARDADELYEILRAHVALTPTQLMERSANNGEVDGSSMLGQLDRGSRAVRVRLALAAPEVVVTAEDMPILASAYPETVSSDRRAIGDGKPESSLIPIDDQASVIAPDKAREEIIRRVLATSAPLTISALAERLWMQEADVNRALLSLEAQGAVFQGHFTAALPVALHGDETDGQSSSQALQWCDRYILERIHRQTLNRLRAEVEPCTEEQFVAFRLEWQHIGGANLPRGVDGVRNILEQMAGLAYAPEFWERAILPARVADYRPEYLDLLCLSGEFAWMAAPCDDDDSQAASEFPARIAFVPRRGRALQPGRLLSDDPRSQAVTEVLTKFGAQYLDQIAERAGLSERDTLAALWRLAAAGAVSNDSFAPLRLLWSEPDAMRLIGDGNVGTRVFTRHDAAVRARLKSSLNGRWSMIEPARPDGQELETETHGSDRERELAMLLLRRHGVLTREMLALEQLELSWQELVFTLRWMEYAGLIRRGWFVRALSGEQYALPEAVEALRAKRLPRTGAVEAIAVSATDPANPFGVMLPGCGISREPLNLIVLRGGCLLLGLASRSLMIANASDDESFEAAIAALLKVRPKLIVETIDGTPALESVHVRSMAAMRFHSDGRALVYDGLPGPLPARAMPQAQLQRL